METQPDPGGVFASDQHRRVAASLTIPRSVKVLAASLRGSPEQYWLSEEDSAEALKDLEADGYVANLGDVDDEDTIKAAVKHALHKDEAKTLKARVERGRYSLDGEQWVLTKRGLEALGRGV